eukprot:CAMPEP_0172331786 /NCGR_PEP_ID=MMETSP1058-20130122/62103_1 /TAXON_ID=83371 /ORGANISM="Detonula confervacea, Strain CCMP 353" /LENGTH=370 /DNA_ID=CAMNT_0013049059 /DNA_START=180 /DNA_END=1292 /DNA_ORIENTATION=-
MASPNGNIETIDLDPRSFAPNKGFYKSWEKSFPEECPLFDYCARDSPERALMAVHDAFAFVSEWLPQSVMARLASFPFQKSGPSAILIRGFPIDTDVPPSPTKANIFDDSANRKTDQSTLVPVAESWLLGVSRILGIPVGAPYSTGDRGGLVRDITQNQDDDDVLPMHRDYPAVGRDAKSKITEPEVLILFGVRSDVDDSGAKTVVMDSSNLLRAIDQTDGVLLRATTIQTEIKLPTGQFLPIGQPFHPIIDNEDGTSTVTLNNLPNARYNSPDGGTPTVEAYARISQLAFDMGKRINLKAGDMLIIQNSRLVHGRTKFHSVGSCFDSGRWLVKTYVSNRLWRIPGESLSGGHTEYPNLNPSGWTGTRRE